MFDWSAIITALLSSAVTCGGITSIFYFKENKKAKQLQNDATASEQWKELFEKSDKKCEEKDAKIESLYKENGALRDSNNTLTTENAVLKQQKCEVPGCITRKPPRGY